MREQLRRPLFIFLALIWIVSFLFVSRQSARNTSPDEANATTEATVDNSNVTLDLEGARIVQEAGVILAMRADNENDEVAVGKQVEYVVSIKNDGQERTNLTLVNALPTDLVLEPDAESTVGTLEIGENALSWSGNLTQGDEAVITYHAHPNYFSTPNQTLDNVVSLKFGERTLEANIAIVTSRGISKSFIVYIAQGLEFIARGLESAKIPYAFGFAIVLFTVLVKVVTFPLNVKQIRSSRAQQELQPKIKALQKKYGDDREAMAKAQMELFKEHGINPLGGCLPMLVQMPIWLALYRALMHLANETRVLDGGFFWIPSLAGPVGPLTGNIRGSIDWLLPNSELFLGWGPVIAYLVLPVLLVISQLYTQRMMTPQTDDPQQKTMSQVMMFMPFMFGYFALVVPSGLSLYWFTSNILSMVQQYYMLKDRKADEQAKQKADKEKKSKLPGLPLEVSAAAATIKNSTDSQKQVKDNARRRRSRSKKKRKHKK